MPPIPNKLRSAVHAQSYNGRYEAAWPAGDKPNSGAVLAGDAGVVVAASADVTTAIRMDAAASAIASGAGDLSTGGGSGASISGSVLTLSGSGFGAKSTPNPLVYDDFEAGTNNSVIGGNAPVYRAIGGAWTWGSDNVGGSSQEPIYSNSVLRPNSTRSSRHVFGTGWNSSLVINNQVAAGQERYISFWFRFERSGGTANASENVKPWFYSFTTASETYDGWGESGLGIRTHAYSGQTTYPPPEVVGDTLSSHFNEWVRIEVYLKQSTLGVSNGRHQTIIHKPNASSPVAVVQQYDVTVVTSDSSEGLMNNLYLGSYFNNAGLSGEIYLDDVYFDNTRQRVELSNNATWASRTFSEIQPATAWADTSISARYNKGQFVSGQTGYAFVIDAAGAATYVGSVTIP